jgi:hypothetical protein
MVKVIQFSILLILIFFTPITDVLGLQAEQQRAYFKADRRLIGKFEVAILIKNKAINYLIKKILNTYNDGYINQFEGYKSKKFKPLKFRVLLASDSMEVRQTQNKLMFETYNAEVEKNRWVMFVCLESKLEKCKV